MKLDAFVIDYQWLMYLNYTFSYMSVT